MTAVVKAREKARRLGVLPMFMAAIIAALFGSAVWITVATAVHDDAVFELEGNTATVAQDALPATAEDWDLICNAHPTQCTLVAPVAGTTQSEDHQFVRDAFGAASDNTLTGGSTKDDLNVSSWKWKTASPSPDKNDLSNAFAAKYTKAGGGKFLYFGADRFSNAGNANIAFWFFQSAVSAPGSGGPGTDCNVGSGCPFDGVHVEHGPGPDGRSCYAGSPTPVPPPLPLPAPQYTCTGAAPLNVGLDDTRGDILAVSAFTNGGTQPNIAVYEWVGTGKAPPALCVNNACSLVTLVAAGAGSPCVPGTPGDEACAVVNATNNQPTSWTYTEKAIGGNSGRTVNQYGDGDFFEGGLDLTTLGLADVCFASFLVNTRSSQSVDSVLHDFALGTLKGCTSTTVTKPQTGAGVDIVAPLSITPGASVAVRDHATITVNGVGAFSGTVKFYLCKIDTGTCDGDTNVGEQIGSAQTLTDVAASPPHVVTSVNAIVTSAGRYCWRAEYSGDPVRGVPESIDGSATECFTVDPVTPVVTTTAGAGGASPVALGEAVTDNASISGTAKKPGSPAFGVGATPGANATGTITFTLVKLLAVAVDGSFCGANATPHANETTNTNPQTVSVTNGDGAYGPASFIPDAPGEYHWKASYGGDAPNTLAATHNDLCTDENEKVTVQQLQPQLTTAQKFLPNDSLTVTVAAGAGTLAGTARFELFIGSNDCTSPAVANYNSGAIDITTGTGSGLSRTVVSSNTSEFVEQTDLVSWRVTYTTTNTGHKSIPATCHENSALTITNGGLVPPTP